MVGEAVINRNSVFSLKTINAFFNILSGGAFAQVSPFSSPTTEEEKKNVCPNGLGLFVQK